jgi:hypothetical protein
MVPRFKRFLKRVAIGGVLFVAVALIANAILMWRANHRLESRLAAIRAAGDPISFADLAANPPPPEENAVALLKELEPQLSAFSAKYSKFSDTELGMALGERTDRGMPPTPEQVSEMETILDSFPELTKAAAKILACPRYAVLLTSSASMDQILESAQRLRALWRFVDWQMAVLTEKGKRDESIAMGIQFLQVARKSESSTGIMSWLVAIACRGVLAERINQALRAGPISPQVRRELDQELAIEDDPQRVVSVMKKERAFSMSQFDEMSKQIGPVFLAWRLKNWQSDSLDFFARIISVADQPWYRARSDYRGRIGPTKQYTNALVELMFPATQAAFSASNRDVARLRCLRILNALCRYREENGHEAPGLESLGLPAASTIDPFTGKPLQLKSTPDGWVIYSLMTNGTDEGGDFKDLADYGLAPAGYPR